MTKQRQTVLADALADATLAFASFVLELQDLKANGKPANVRNANAARHEAKRALLALGCTVDEAEAALKEAEARNGF